MKEEMKGEEREISKMPGAARAGPPCSFLRGLAGREGGPKTPTLPSRSVGHQAASQACPAASSHFREEASCAVCLGFVPPRATDRGPLTKA